jgi:hypothetical protein
MRSSGREKPQEAQEYLRLSCGQNNNSKELSIGSGPHPSLMRGKTLEAATVSVDRCAIGACFGEPIQEFDSRPVRNNIGDTQPLLALR